MLKNLDQKKLEEILEKIFNKIIAKFDLMDNSIENNINRLKEEDLVDFLEFVKEELLNLVKKD